MRFLFHFGTEQRGHFTFMKTSTYTVNIIRSVLYNSYTYIIALLIKITENTSSLSKII